MSPWLYCLSPRLPFLTQPNQVIFLQIKRWAASASTDGSSRAQTSAFHVAPDLPKQEGAQGVTTLPDLVRCPLPQDVEGPAWHFSLGSMICTLKALTPEAMPLPASLVCGEKEGALPTIDPPDRLQSGGARDTEVLLGVLLLLPFLWKPGVLNLSIQKGLQKSCSPNSLLTEIEAKKLRGALWLADH